MCLMFALVDCLLFKAIQQNKDCKHHVKDEKEFFFIKSSKFGKVQIGHLHTCPLHFKLMPTTSLSPILHYEERIDNTFEKITTETKLLLNFSDYLIRIFSQSVVTCHVRLCIVINHSLSLCQCRKHKPTFQIINNL